MIETPFLKAEGLSLLLGGKKILHNISFEVKKGGFTGIIGPNGAGKSSLLKCLGGLYRISEGQVFLEGVPLASMKKRDIARRIAWVHQSGSEALPFTVREFAAMSRYPWQKTLGCENKEDRDIIKQALATAGVEKIADRELNSLSGGERQKALIAAALAQNTDLLFLDEPTSFLDYRHQSETLELIERVNQKHGITVLLVTHDINLALHGAGEIAAVKQGEMVWHGSGTELLQKGLLKEIFEIEFESFSSRLRRLPYVAPAELS